MNNVKLFLFTCLLVIGLSPISAQNNNLQKADKYYELYAFHQATTYYEAVLEKSPASQEAMIKLADCYRHLNQYDKAEKWYKKIIESPIKEDVDIFFYATVLKAQGKYKEAKNWYLKYAETNAPVGNHYANSCDYALTNQSKRSSYKVGREYTVNSGFADFGPAFYKNDLVFSSFRSLGNTSSEFDKETQNQLYTTHSNSSGNLKEPVLLKKGITSTANIGYPSFDEHFNYVAYVKNNNNFTNGVLPMAGSGVKMDIKLAKAIDAVTWEDVSSYPYNETEISNGYPFLCENGTKLYFASDRRGGYGGYDLYVSTKTGDTWSEPTNLGSTVNSPGNEISPHLSNSTLYFASDWHIGYGGFDLFKVEQKGKHSWSMLQNLGPQINSPSNDYDLVFDNNQNIGYFVSNRNGGKGKEDLFNFSKSDAAEMVDILVVNATSEEALEGVSVDLSACGLGLVKTNSQGMVTIPSGLSNCEALIQKSGYSNKKVSLINENQMTVFITPVSSFFIGQIKNTTTNDWIDGVVVKLMDASTYKTIDKTITDSQGRYRLSLQPSTDYKAVFSKIGFVNKDIRLSTNKMVGEDVLANISLEPSPFVDMNVQTAKTQPKPVPGRGKPAAASTPSDWRDSADLVAKGIPEPKVVEVKESNQLSIQNGILIKNAPIANAPVTSTQEVKTNINKSTAYKPVAQRGVKQTMSFSRGVDVYEIQIGAFSKPDHKQLAGLGDIGLVYGDRKEKLVFYKVGTFKTKQEADVALVKIKKRGFKDAFVRKITNFNPIVSAMHEEAVVSPPSTPISSTGTTTSMNSGNTAVFKVQLGAFKKNSVVSFSDQLNRAGQIYSTTNGNGVTIYLLGDFGTISEAKNAKELAKREGVESPFIVAYKDGLKISVQEALKNK